MSGSRRFGSFSRQRRSNRRTLDGVCSGNAFQFGSRSMIAAMVSDSVSPLNAAWPISISYKTHPKAQMSVRLSTARPRACSGLM